MTQRHGSETPDVDPRPPDVPEPAPSPDPAPAPQPPPGSPDPGPARSASGRLTVRAAHHVQGLDDEVPIESGDPKRHADDVPEQRRPSRRSLTTAKGTSSSLMRALIRWPPCACATR